jgi:vacuolar-type H+-ATPase subunit D/Vma8
VQKRQKEDGELDAEIKAAEVAMDYHTVENRNMRKGMQERRNQLAREIQLISENIKHGQKSLQSLYQSIESNLELAKHAETGEWKEARAENVPINS